MASVPTFRLATEYRFHSESLSMICGLVYTVHVATVEMFSTFIYPAEDSAEQANHFSPPPFKTFIHTLTLGCTTRALMDTVQLHWSYWALAVDSTFPAQILHISLMILFSLVISQFL